LFTDSQGLSDTAIAPIIVGLFHGPLALLDAELKQQHGRSARRLSSPTRATSQDLILEISRKTRDQRQVHLLHGSTRDFRSLQLIYVTVEAGICKASAGDAGSARNARRTKIR